MLVVVLICVCAALAAPAAPSPTGTPSAHRPSATVPTAQTAPGAESAKGVLTPTPTPEAAPTFTGGVDINWGHQILITVFWLAVMAAVIWLVMRYLYDRVGGSGATGGSRRGIQLIDRHVLGPQRALLLVRVAGKVLLLGMTEQRITALTELRPDDFDTDAAVGASSRTVDLRRGAAAQSASPRESSENPAASTWSEGPSTVPGMGVESGVSDLARLFGRKSARAAKGDDRE